MIKNNKGFTIIEMITLLVIIGSLMLLAIPKFDGLATKAEIVNISNDLYVMETVVLTKMIIDNELPINKNQLPINKSDLEYKVINNMIFDKQGIVDLNRIDIEKTFYIIDKTFIEDETTSKLNGDFILDANGNTLYINGEEAHMEESVALNNILNNIKKII